MDASEWVGGVVERTTNPRVGYVGCLSESQLVWRVGAPDGYNLGAFFV